MRTARTARRNSAGFTLIELILALALSVMLVASLFTSLHVAIKAKESGAAAIKPLAQLEIAMEMVRADLDAAQPPNGILEGEFEGTQSGGGDAESDQLYFFNNGLVAGHHQDGVGEIKQVGLLLEQQGADQVLVRQVIPNPVLVQQTPTPDEEIICRNVTSFGLQYYDGEQWQTSWDSSQYGNALPAAVSVTLVVVDPDTRKTYHLRRVVALSCVAQQTTQTGATGATGAGAGAGGGGGNSGGGKSGGGGAGGGAK
jgi:type II secretion system protein J